MKKPCVLFSLSFSFSCFEEEEEEEEKKKKKNTINVELNVGAHPSSKKDKE